MLLCPVEGPLPEHRHQKMVATYDPPSLLKRRTISPRPFKRPNPSRESSQNCSFFYSHFFFPPTIFFDQQFTLNLKTQLLFPFTDDLLIKNIFLTNFLLSNIFHDFPVELRILQQKNKNGTKLVELKNSCIVNQYY